MLDQLQLAAVLFAQLAWGPWLLMLLLGGGLFLMIFSGALPLRHLNHGWQVLRGRYDDQTDPGQISHFQALSAALAGTIGMGNIGGVALAIGIG